MSKKKTLFVVFAIVFSGKLLFPTRQIPDIIKYKKCSCILETSWEWDNPLKKCIKSSQKKYPFKRVTSAITRGHIATYEIHDKKLFLIRVDIPVLKKNAFKITPRKKMFNYKKYGLSRLPMKSKVSNNRVWLRCFSGYMMFYTDYEELKNSNCRIIQSRKNDKQYFFLKIDKGKVIKKLENILLSSFDKIRYPYEKNSNLKVEKRYQLIKEWFDYVQASKSKKLSDTER